MKNKIFNFIHSLGIEKCGIARYGEKSAIVCLFPYYAGERNANLSLYARGLDYHLVIKEKLSPVCDFISTLVHDANCEIFADIGPEIDRQLAYAAGLGFYGKNRMLKRTVFRRNSSPRPVSRIHCCRRSMNAFRAGKNCAYPRQ